MKRLAILLLLVLGLISVLSADYADLYYNFSRAFSPFADPNTGLTAFPTLLIPMGGRREGMGTAYTAVARDSGYIESNPSASSSLEYGELSLFHHSWIADSNMEGLVFTMRLEDLGIGVGGKYLYVPFTEYDSWGVRESKGYYSEAVGTLNVSYNFFSNYYFYGLAVGANIKAAYRNVPAVIHPGQSVLTGMMDFGLLTRLNLLKFYYAHTKNFSLGLTLRNLGLPALGDPLPTVAALGIAYAPLRPLTIALDFNYPISLDPVNYPAERWYVASGVDVSVTNFLSIQSGFQFKGDNPKLSVGSTVMLHNISFVVNYNLDLSGSLNPLDKFSVEAKLNLGDRGRINRKQMVEELYLNGLDAYAQGKLVEAINYWQQVLEIDPDFIPARENIDTAQRALQLQESMEDHLKIGE